VNTETQEELQQLVNDFENRNIKFLLVGNKLDTNEIEHINRKFGSIRTNSLLFAQASVLISAKLNQHIDVLKEKLVHSVLQGNVQAEDTIITNARHYHALKELSQSLNDIKVGLDDKIPTDLIALDIRRGLHFLGEITGEITNEDQLDYIFSKFCIGK
jgi:tRNA modification GTPase